MVESKTSNTAQPNLPSTKGEMGPVPECAQMALFSVKGGMHAGLEGAAVSSIGWIVPISNAWEQKCLGFCEILEYLHLHDLSFGDVI